MRVTAAAAAVRVAMFVEEDETDNVAQQAHRADNDNQLGVADLGRGHESLDGLEEDAEAQRDQEDTVDEGAKDLCTLPSVRVLVRAGAGGQLDRVERDDEREDIAEKR